MKISPSKWSSILKEKRKTFMESSSEFREILEMMKFFIPPSTPCSHDISQSRWRQEGIINDLMSFQRENEKWII